MHRSIVFTLALWLLSAPLCEATWSIVLVDTATGEVAVAAATCLEGGTFDLQRLLPVILVGRGAAAAQSAIDTGAVNRKKMVAGLLAGLTPAEIIETLKQGDLLKCSRQYGIVDSHGDSAAFTGPCCGAFASHVRGVVGSLSYSIQGNVITGSPVLQAAEAALVSSTGNTADRLLAAMEAARSMGGDGRCSCEASAPTSCGSPPVAGFEKSAHIGFAIVARIGDTDGSCSGLGCATGDYWLDLSFNGTLADPDPVLVLQQRYEHFRERMRGQPDGLESLWSWRAPVALPGGGTLLELDVVLQDVDGQPLGHGGAQLGVEHAPGSAGLSVRHAVIDHGDGRYTLQMLAPTGGGTDVLAVGIDQGGVHATLFPYPSIPLPATLVPAARTPATEPRWGR